MRSQSTRVPSTSGVSGRSEEPAHRREASHAESSG
jgi:hypothetical protein